MPATPTAPSSDFYNITNISGNTAEDGTAATFKVALDESPALPAPSAPSVSGSDFYNITNVSGHTAEDGTTATFKVALDESPALPAPAACSYDTSSTPEARPRGGSPPPPMSLRDSPLEIYLRPLYRTHKPRLSSNSLSHTHIEHSLLSSTNFNIPI